MQEQGAQHQGIQQQEMQQQIQIQKQQPTIFANGRWMNQQDEINQQEYGGMVQQDFGGVDQQENRGMNQQGISMMAPLQGIQQQQQQQQHQHSQVRFGSDILLFGGDWTIRKTRLVTLVCILVFHSYKSMSMF